MSGGIFGIRFKDLRVRWLEVLSAWRLHLDHRISRARLATEIASLAGVAVRTHAHIHGSAGKRRYVMFDGSSHDQSEK